MTDGTVTITSEAGQVVVTIRAPGREPLIMRASPAVADSTARNLQRAAARIRGGS